jgi:hypothetical protein
MIDKPEPRRFPPPWIAEETDACFVVRDANGYRRNVSPNAELIAQRIISFLSTSRRPPGSLTRSRNF